MFSLAILLTLNLHYSCNYMESREKVVDSLFLDYEKVEHYYKLSQPVKKHFLPDVLSEVSGLTFTDEGKLLMVEDETGAVYEYDLESEKVTYRMVFGDGGDYEGVEYFQGRVYVLESNGNILHFKYEKDVDIEAELIDTPLNSSNDCEGLGFHHNHKSLLIATKEDGDIKGNKVKGNGVYLWDVESGKFSKDELLAITSGKLRDYYTERKNQEYDEEKFVFEPSAIAYHPIDHQIYVLASKGKLLLVLDDDGNIVASYPILPKVLTQPEGICFAPDGKLFIASEGDGGLGYILEFEMFTK